MHVFGLRQRQLEVLVPLDFDDVVTAWVLGQVGVQQVVVHVQQIVQQLPVVLVPVTSDRLAALQTPKPIPPIPRKAMNSHLVNPLQLKRRLMHKYTFSYHPTPRFFRSIPVEANPREGRVPTCQIGIHRHTVLQSLQQHPPRHQLHHYPISNDILDNPKGNGTRLDHSIHPEVATVHHGDIRTAFVAVDGDQELQEGTLLLPDGAEPQIQIPHRKAGRFLLLLLELLVDLDDVVVQIGVRYDGLPLVVHLLQLDLEHPFLGAMPGSPNGEIPTPLLPAILLHPHNRKMPKISTTLHQHSLPMHFMRDHMIMSPQNEIDALHLLGQLDIVVLHHMRQSDNDVAVHLLAEFDDHLACEFDEGDAVADLLVVGVERVDPLLLRQTEETDPSAPPLHHVRLQSLSQSTPGTHVVDVAEQPREVGLLDQLHHMFQLVVQIVVAEAGEVDPERIQRPDHILALELGRYERGGKGITGEQRDGLLVLALLALEEGLEVGGASLGLLLVGLYIVDVVEMENSQFAFTSLHNQYVLAGRRQETPKTSDRERHGTSQEQRGNAPRGAE